MNQVQVSAVSAVGVSSFFVSFFFSFFVLEPFGLPTFFWGVSSVSIFPFGFGVSGGPDILNIGQLHATAWDHGSQQKRVGHSWDWATAPGSQGVVSKRFATSSITLAYRSMELKKWGSGWGKKGYIFHYSPAKPRRIMQLGRNLKLNGHRRPQPKMTRRNSGTVRLVNVSVTTYACQKCQKLFLHKCSGAMWGASVDSLELLPASWNDRFVTRMHISLLKGVSYVKEWFCYHPPFFVTFSTGTVSGCSCSWSNRYTSPCWARVGQAPVRNAGGMFGPQRTLKMQINFDFSVLWPQSTQNSNTMANIDLQSNMT